MEIAPEDRVIALSDGMSGVPERLLLAHAGGKVLFICGAGISRPAGLPDFRTLVMDVYQDLDASVHAVMLKVPQGACNQWQVDCAGLNDQQTAEVRRFVAGDYDVVLGMLERRIDSHTRDDSRVRQEVCNKLRIGSESPAPIHKAMMSLADRGGVKSIVTTNFDLLLEEASKKQSPPVNTYTLGAIPRPSLQKEFSGVLHIHGALDRNPSRSSDLVLTDEDFGEFYLRRRIVPDFIYDAARLYHLVLVGYSANDPPMRYLLNAVAAESKRFTDLKERFTFFGTGSPDPVGLADWKGRGITPIWYDSRDHHAALHAGLLRWSELSAVNGNQKVVDRDLRRIVKNGRSNASDADRDLFDHFFRRGNEAERVRMASLISQAGAEIGWLSTMTQVISERERR